MQNKVHKAIGLYGNYSKNLYPIVRKRVGFAPTSGNKITTDNHDFIPLSQPIEVINKELPSDINQEFKEENMDFVAEEDATNIDHQDDDEGAPGNSYDSSYNSNSDSGSDTDTEIDQRQLGWSNAKLEKRENIDAPPLPATSDNIRDYLSSTKFSGFDVDHVKIELNDTEMPSGTAFRDYIERKECYISFYIENEVLEITHFECPGGGKELLYDMIIKLSNRFFFGLVGLEASPWMSITEKKDKKEQKNLVKQAQKKLNDNYLSMGFKYVDRTSNIFSANVVELLSKLEQYRRIGGQKKQTKKRRQTKKGRQTKMRKSIRKMYLKKNQKSKKKNQRKN